MQSKASDPGQQPLSVSVDTQQPDKSKSSPSEHVQFDEFSKLPTGLRHFVTNNLIGMPLEDIDSSYKDKQVNLKL